MTEDEAKKKFCPQQFTPETSERYAEMCCCTGSNCMAWRWKWDSEPYQMNMATTGAMPKPKRWQTEHGYCGLAGRTED